MKEVLDKAPNPKDVELHQRLNKLKDYNDIGRNLLLLPPGFNPVSGNNNNNKNNNNNNNDNNDNDFPPTDSYFPYSNCVLSADDIPLDVPFLTPP